MKISFNLPFHEIEFHGKVKFIWLLWYNINTAVQALLYDNEIHK